MVDIDLTNKMSMIEKLKLWAWRAGFIKKVEKAIAINESILLEVKVIRLKQINNVEVPMEIDTINVYPKQSQVEEALERIKNMS